MLSNKPLGEQYAEAIEAHAKVKVDAMRLRKKAERILDVRFLEADGRNADERRAKAKQAADYQKADLEAEEAEYKEIEARSCADALKIRWESWRSELALAREEMKLAR